MDQQEVINKIDLILEDAKAAVLATSDPQGKSHLRWMTPVVLKYQPNAIYCFTAAGSEKLKHISTNNKGTGPNDRVIEADVKRILEEN